MHCCGGEWGRHAEKKGTYGVLIVNWPKALAAKRATVASETKTDLIVDCVEAEMSARCEKGW